MSKRHTGQQPAQTALADRLDQTLAQLRQAMSEAHSLHKALIASSREARQLVDREVRAVLDQAVAEQLEELGLTVSAEMDKCVERVGSEFDRLGQLLLATDRDVSMRDMVLGIAAMPGQQMTHSTPRALKFDSDVLGRVSESDEPVKHIGNETLPGEQTPEQRSYRHERQIARLQSDVNQLAASLSHVFNGIREIQDHVKETIRATETMDQSG